MRDSQRSAIYKWEMEAFKQSLPEEDNIITSMILEDDDCVRLIQNLWGIYGSGALPKILFSNRHTWAWGSSRRIVLPKWARNFKTIVHEVVHAVLDRQWHHGDLPHFEGGPHGPLFASSVIGIWEDLFDCDTKIAIRLGDTQKPRRVKFAPLGFAKLPQNKSSRNNLQQKEVRRIVRKYALKGWLTKHSDMV